MEKQQNDYVVVDAHREMVTMAVVVMVIEIESTNYLQMQYRKIFIQTFSPLSDGK